MSVVAVSHVAGYLALILGDWLHALAKYLALAEPVNTAGQQNAVSDHILYNVYCEIYYNTDIGRAGSTSFKYRKWHACAFWHLTWP